MAQQHEVFISHSSLDRIAANTVRAALEDVGIGCWIAPRDIPVGVEWSVAIVAALHRCRALLLLYTAASNESPQVLREVERAVSLRRPIVTIKLEEAPMTPGMEYFISVSEWVPSVDTPVENCLPALVARVREQLERAAASPDTGRPAPGGGPSSVHTSVLTAPEEPPTNLSTHVEGFLGREREVETACELLTGNTVRLVTISGMGGLGKTRLSQEVGYNLHSARPAPFPDGVFVAELAAVTDPALVPQVVASVLSVREDTGRTMTQALTTALRNKRLLLLIDNCEHVLGATATLAAALMRECPNVRLLATSRERLSVTGERVLPLGPLPLPSAPTPAQVAASAAGSLFVRRAQAVQEGFELNDANAAAVTEICRRLDGIPLALELAAARVRSLSPQQIAQRLDQRFRLLTGGSRDLLPHQQTLRALVDWSFDLLSDAEKALLCRLSVFSGGATLEAAEAVSTSDLVEDWEVADYLHTLVDKSLLIAEEGGERSGDTMRYRMLETIRQYSRDRLAESGAETEACDRHAAYFRDFAARTSDFDALESEEPNLRVALDRFLSQDGIGDAAAMALALKEFWWRRGRVREGRSLLERLLARESAMSDTQRAGLLGAAGWLAHLQAEYTTADQQQQASLEICRAAGLAGSEADALNNLGLSALAQGRTAEARECFLESLDVTARIGDERRRAARLSNLVLVALQENRYDEAEERLREARGVYECLSDVRGAAACLVNLTDLALRQQHWDEAEARAQESLALFRKIDDPLGVALSLTNLAEAVLQRGAPAEVETYSREALSVCINAGLLALLPTVLEIRARAFAAGQEKADAALCLAAADHLRTLLNSPRSPEEQAAVEVVSAMVGPAGVADFRFDGLSPEETVLRTLASMA